MVNPNFRNLVIYGKPQEGLVEAVKNLPDGRSVAREERLPIKLEYGDTLIYLDTTSDGTLITATISPQDESKVAVPFSEDKLQLLARDLDAVGIPYSWDLSENDHKKLG